MWPKPVLFTARFGPNYLWHILAVAGIGYTSDYAHRYGYAVRPQDIELLRRHESLLRFGNGQSSSMTAFFTFLPAWLSLDTRPEFSLYFEVLDHCFSSGSLCRLAVDFPAADWSDPFFRDLPATRWPAANEDRVALGELASAYMANLDDYAQLVWPIAQSEMSGRVAQLTEWFGRHDHIAAWEQAMDVSFATDHYEIVLCHSNNGGPDYNSLGYRGNLFYFAKPFDRTWQFVSHEIGTHLLSDVMRDVARDAKWTSASLYQAFEVLAMFFNRRVLGVEHLAYDMPPMYHHREVLTFYAGAFRDGLAPADLLRMGADYVEHSFASDIGVGDESA